MSKKKAAPTASVSTTQKDINNVPAPSAFRLSGNLREERLLAALMEKPHLREHLDRRVGASNSPDIVFRLRNRGLAIDCERIVVKDRDGNECRCGLYSLDASARKAVRAALKGGA
jgi:hypothetical protein